MFRPSPFVRDNRLKIPRNFPFFFYYTLFFRSCQEDFCFFRFFLFPFLSLFLFFPRPPRATGALVFRPTHTAPAPPLFHRLNNLPNPVKTDGIHPYPHTRKRFLLCKNLITFFLSVENGCIQSKKVVLYMYKICVPKNDLFSDAPTKGACRE